METKVINGINVQIIRKKVKNARIKVCNTGIVEMVIPQKMPESNAVILFNKKINWVKKHLKHHKPTHRFLFKDGEEFFLFGEKFTLNVIKSRKNSFVLLENSLILCLKNEDEKTVKDRFYKALSSLLLKRAEPLFEKWSAQTGLTYNQIRVHKTTSRWGSCNVKTKNVNLSVYLVNLPEYCLDYVVLHELCHVRYANHGDGFKNMLYEYMPYWKTVRKYIKDNSHKYKLVD